MTLSTGIKSFLGNCMKAVANIFLVRGSRSMILVSESTRKNSESSYMCESGVCFESNVTV